MESTYQFHFGGTGMSSWGATGGSSLVAETGKYVPTAVSVQEFAQQEDSNSMYRPYMEDTYCAEDNFAGDSTCGVFGVFDGHGGKTVSEYIKDRVPEELKKNIMINQPTDLTQTLEDVFLKVDGELRLMDSENTGSTAVLSVIRMESGHRIVYFANCGDTRAVISRNGVSERMTVDHKCNDPMEVERIKSEGGVVIDERVGGTLAVARAFGDYSLKNEGVTASPYVRKHFLRPFDKYLIIATDGVWDVLSDQQAVDLCKDEMTSQEMAKTIVQNAMELGSRDNICVLVLKF